MQLPPELVGRILDRASDPQHRTDAASGAVRVRGMRGTLARMFNRFGQLPGSCSERGIAAAEAALGFRLPEELRQLYRDVADGGFGPKGGIYSLKELVAKYREMTRQPAGEGGQEWPRKLLPVLGERWDLVSIDRESGALVFFDVDELEGRSDRYWRRAFKHEAASFEAWLSKLVERPKLVPRRATPYKMKQYKEEELAHWEEENPEFLRRSAIFRMTPEERAAIGLPEVGWEEMVFEGFDLAKVTRVRRQQRRPN